MNKKLVLSIAVPASFVSDVPHLREKTAKIGLVARAAAIFRVNEIIIYPDVPRANQKQEANLIATVLSYAETPQYLRKHLFKISPELRYAGILPPLRTPHHPIANKIDTLRDSEYREGVVIAHAKNGSLVDIGVERPILLQGSKQSINTRVSVKIAKIENILEARLAEKKEIGVYWGYKVTVSRKPLGQTVREGAFDLVIATSRLGQPFNKAANQLVDTLKNSERVLVAFGAPAKGLHDIAKAEGIKLEDVARFIVNTIPCQGTETVRTEEAVYASLAVLRVLMA